jgi:hypothetical protein
MTNRERFQKTFAFQPVDRLPVIEWAGWWNLTIDNWHKQGLSEELVDANDIRDFFGQDSHRQLWIGATGPDCPPRSSENPLIKDRQDYLNLKPYLYPSHAVNKEHLEMCAKEQASGHSVVWLTLEGPFWYPRTMFGIEPHMTAFYDQADLMKEMNEDLQEWSIKCYEEFCSICVPDFMTFAEDMSYNHGPMIGKNLFEEFITPFYRRVVPVMRNKGTVVIVDTDGDVTHPISWYMEAGVQGFLPLERMAGVDVSAIRKEHPDVILLGAFDKTVMHLGEERMRMEFERLLPVMKQGGFIPSCDHQTPPAVSMDDYWLYMRLLREYCELAAK